jgi:hypothetical protein
MANHVNFGPEPEPETEPEPVARSKRKKKPKAVGRDPTGLK